MYVCILYMYVSLCIFMILDILILLYNDDVNANIIGCHGNIVVTFS